MLIHQKGSFPNRSSLPESASSNDNFPGATCGLMSCSISLDPVTLYYPTPFQLVEITTTATLIPVIKVYPNGSEETVTSTFGVYNTNGSNQTFHAPTTSDLTWETYHTTLYVHNCYTPNSIPNIYEEPTRRYMLLIQVQLLCYNLQFRVKQGSLPHHAN
jgi:hypothetical protein